MLVKVSGSLQPHFAHFARKQRRNLASSDLLVQTSSMTKELIFDVEQDGDFLVAVCHDPEMATQGANIEELIAMIRDLVRCRFVFPEF